MSVNLSFSNFSSPRSDRLSDFAPQGSASMESEEGSRAPSVLDRSFDDGSVSLDAVTPSHVESFCFLTESAWLLSGVQNPVLSVPRPRMRFFEKREVLDSLALRSRDMQAELGRVSRESQEKNLTEIDVSWSQEQIQDFILEGEKEIVQSSAKGLLQAEAVERLVHCWLKVQLNGVRVKPEFARDVYVRKFSDPRSWSQECQGIIKRTDKAIVLEQIKVFSKAQMVQ